MPACRITSNSSFAISSGMYALIERRSRIHLIASFVLLTSSILLNKLSRRYHTPGILFRQADESAHGMALQPSYPDCSQFTGPGSNP